MKTARLFKNGQSQAVRLPKEFRFSGDQVYIKKSGNAVVLIPMADSWEPLLDSISLFSGDFMSRREQPGPQHRKKPFDEADA